jgi:predicted transcriptional regulator
MRRAFYTIMSEILYLGLGGVVKTNLINSCKISNKMCEKYITTLLEKGLFEKNGNHFHTTLKGIQFIETYQELERLWDINTAQKIAQRAAIRKKRRLGLASSLT